MSEPRVFTYATPWRVVSGAGSVSSLPDQLRELGCSRVVVMSTRSLEPHVAAIEGLLGDLHVGTYTKFRQHTPLSTVEEAAKIAQGCDGIVAYGGGSVIDGAKAVADRIGRPPQVAIPTTLSAGEFTPAAGVTDDTTRVKGATFHPEIQPRVVIHDAALARHTPESLWLSTGMRALDHAIEAVWSKHPHPMATPLALEAIRLLSAQLSASRDPQALDARSDCLDAAWLSISGIMNAGVRLSHPIGHQVGAYWDVPHGVTSCISLPPVMRHLLPETRDAQERIADALGAAGAAAAADAVADLVRELGLPGRLRDVGARREDLPAVAGAIGNELEEMGDPEQRDAVLGLLEQMW
jgi:alcohol dehydrogenase class IV